MLLLAPSVALASSDNEELMQQVHAFLYEQASPLGEEILIEVQPPSPHLPPCVAPEPFLTNTSQSPLGRVSVGVRCGDTGRQVRYLQAEVGVIGNFVKAASAIERGTLVTADMLEEHAGNLNELPSQALLEAADIVGQVARRPIRAGSVFQSHYLQAPTVIERGQRVVVEARGSAFRVSREGEALESGGVGDRVRVRFGAREVLTARVAEEGTLIIDF
ncbi:flagellar basal body P-ring formation chaperone FlgA [Halomonas sp. Bachu 37]|uniref:flagellar basal body P-ring formation chaperone FlgA n=1 Tax=Halomonas kashgarensis TaxID=3084920 RepID=UPI003216D8C8